MSLPSQNRGLPTSRECATAGLGGRPAAADDPPTRDVVLLFRAKAGHRFGCLVKISSGRLHVELTEKGGGQVGSSSRRGVGAVAASSTRREAERAAARGNKRDQEKKDGK